MAREQLVVHAANRLFVQVKKVEGAIISMHPGAGSNSRCGF
jgi:hypothetical protein